MFRQVLAMQVLQLSGWWHITVVGGDKALAVPQPEEKTIGAIVVERLLPRSHQLLRGTHRRLKDWIIPSKWVKLHGSKSVLCQIRAMLALSLLFASGKKKKTAVSLSNCGQLGAKVKASLAVSVALWRHIAAARGETNLYFLAFSNWQLRQACHSNWGRSFNVPGKSHCGFQESWDQIQEHRSRWFCWHKIKTSNSNFSSECTSRCLALGNTWLSGLSGWSQLCHIRLDKATHPHHRAPPQCSEMKARVQFRVLPSRHYTILIIIIVTIVRNPFSLSQERKQCWLFQGLSLLQPLSFSGDFWVWGSGISGVCRIRN